MRQQCGAGGLYCSRRFTAGHAERGKGLLTIGLDQGRPPPEQGIARIGIDRDNHLVLLGQTEDQIHQFLGDKTLAVILDNDSIHLRDGLFQITGQLAQIGGREPDALLPVNPHHLLMTGYDPGLDSGGEPAAHENALAVNAGR